MKAYEDLRANASAFFEMVYARRSADMTCEQGCDACCYVQLTVCAVEADAIRSALSALDENEKRTLRERAVAMDVDSDAGDGACVMLGRQGCTVYEARPLVCRTHGLPIAYTDAPDVPVDALLDAKSVGAERRTLTWCELNFEEHQPAREDVLDGDRLNQALAMVNRAFESESREQEAEQAGERFSLVALVQNVC